MNKNISFDHNTNLYDSSSNIEQFKPSQNNYRTIIISLGFITLFLAAALLYLIYQNKELSDKAVVLETKIQEQSFETAASIDSSDKRAESQEAQTSTVKQDLPDNLDQDFAEDWQVYTDEEVGIKLKYPTGWFVYNESTVVNPEGRMTVPPNLTYLSPEFIPEEDFPALTHGLPGSFGIHVVGKKGGNSWTWDYFEEIQKDDWESATNLDGEAINKKEIISIGDIEAYKIIRFRESPGDMPLVGGTDVYLVNEGTLITFSYPNEYNTYYSPIRHEQILSTLEIF